MPHELLWGHQPDWWLAIFTAVLALITFLLALFTAKLWGTTGRLVEGAELTAQRQLRAYIHLVEGRISKEATGCVRANFAFKNFGQTPAYDVVQWSNFGVGHRGDDLPPLVDIPTPSRTSMGPGAGTSIQFLSAPLEPEQFNAIEAGNSSFYVYGRFAYRDVFGESHETRFRFEATGEPYRQGLFTNCAEGNEAT